jgi:hypothetical protein
MVLLASNTHPTRSSLSGRRTPAPGGLGPAGGSCRRPLAGCASPRRPWRSCTCRWRGSAVASVAWRAGCGVRVYGGASGEVSGAGAAVVVLRSPAREEEPVSARGGGQRRGAPSKRRALARWRRGGEHTRACTTARRRPRGARLLLPVGHACQPIQTARRPTEKLVILLSKQNTRGLFGW